MIIKVSQADGSEVQIIPEAGASRKSKRLGCATAEYQQLLLLLQQQILQAAAATSSDGGPCTI